MADEGERVLQTGVVTPGRRLGHVDAHQLAALLVVLAEELEERAAVRGAAPQKALQHVVDGVGSLFELQFAVDENEACPDVFEVEIEVFAQCRTRGGPAAFGIPQLGSDALADGGVGALAVDRDADAHGDLPVLVGSRPTHVERDPKSTFLSIHMLHVLTGCKVTPPCAKSEHAKCRESANKNLRSVAESGAEGDATELPAEELPQGGVLVRPRKTKIPVSVLLTGIMGFLSNPLSGERGSRTCTISKYHTIANAY